MSAIHRLQSNVSLRNHNTFGIDAKARYYIQIFNVAELAEIRALPILAGLPRLILGGGSNVLLTADFAGVVLHLCSNGIEVIGEDASATYVRAAAGENWHRFVQWTLQHGFGGLENLSLIPGSVGAAPIQNIGAYGAELKSCLHQVTVYDWKSGAVSELSRDDCCFGYRDSVFKHALRERAVITEVTFALPKQWQANVFYAELQNELGSGSNASLSARQISDAVIAIRTRKLPDPAQVGNAGSFFKNPVVTAALRNDLLQHYPQMVSYEQADGRFKLAAGWLIDQCGWKGKKMGAAGVYERQALVLVNHGGAAGTDVMQLARAIQDDVKTRFGVLLEIEPVVV